jgi:ABC-type transport system involved in multi-copper enzyme maturation permease subunit
MIWLIAKKEFLEKILDFRVILSFIIAILLTIVATFVAGEDYQAQKKEYDKFVSQSQSIMSSIKVYSQFKPVIYYPPSQLSVFSKGSDIPTPIKVNIEIYEVPRYQARSSGSNPLMSIFDTLDIATVIRVLFSLLVILLTFDSFSGEKEQGTLRHILSNPIARVNILFGKFIGNIMIITVVIILTFLITIILTRISSGIGFTIDQFIRFILMTVVTILYLSVFSALGIYISLRFQHSSASLAVLLIIWFFVAILQQNLNTYIVSEFESKDWKKDIQSASIDYECEARNQLEELQKERSNIFESRSKRMYGYSPGYMYSSTYSSIIMFPVISDANYNILDYLIKQVHIYRRLSDCGEKMFNYYNIYNYKHLNQQLGWRRDLDLLSPAALYTRSMSIISRTDVDNIDNFFEQAREYRHQYLTYLDQRGIFTNNAHLYFSRLDKNQIDQAATQRRMAMYERDSSLIPYLENQSSLDLRDAPFFNYKHSILTVDIGKVIELIVPILLLFAILFYLTGRSIKRYDAR